MQNYAENMWCSLFVLDQKKPFLGKSGQKVKTVSLT